MCAMDLLTCGNGATNSDSQVGTVALDSDAELSLATLNSDELFSDGSPSSEVLCNGEPEAEVLCSGEPEAEYQPSKRRRKSSEVWEFFTVQAVDPQHCRAFCNHCRRSFSYINGSKSVGTSHLKRHIKSAVCPAGRHFNGSGQLLLQGSTPEPKINGSPDDVTQKPKKRKKIAQDSTGVDLADQPKKRKKAASGKAAISYFDEDCCSHDMAKMIIQHGYPLDMVAHSGFNKFIRTLQPQYQSASVSTIEEHIQRIYMREKHNVLSLLSEIPGNVNLTLDSWCSDENKCYVVLTAHFIDSDWKLHRRVLNATILPLVDSEVCYIQAVASCLTDWNIDRKLFVLTLNQYVDGEKTVRENLRGLLSIKNRDILNGQLVMVSCYARALSGVAQEGLELMKETVEKIRQNVKYVTTSKLHRDNFAHIRQHLQVPSTRVLGTDDRTKWNTTYEMLMAARDLKEVFSCLDTMHPEYKVNISPDEWRQVETLCTYLNLLYDAAGILTSGSMPTANIIFHDVWKIQSELTLASVSLDPLISNLTTPLKQKFDKYWQDCGLVSAVAVIMDPRLKMKLIEFSIPRIYGEDAGTWTKAIGDGLRDLYDEYVVQSLPEPSVESGGELVDESGELLDDLDFYLSGFVAELKTELEQYLEEPLLPRVQGFDVLGWWKENALRYPTLSKMASDVLSVSFSTVYDRDSVFDLSKKNLEGHWRTLTPATFQALVCAKDWLQYESQTSTTIKRI